MVELVVTTPNPKALDMTVQAFGGVLVEDASDPSGYLREGDAYIVRSHGDPDYLAFAIVTQGYAKIIEKRGF